MSATERDREQRLQVLLDKQEIQDVLVRYCRGLDRGDHELVRSTFHPDAVHNHVGEVRPASELVEGLKRPRRQAMKSIAHYLSNVLVEVRGDHASAESYFLACHRIEHAATEWEWIVGGRYVDELTRRDGTWGIQQRTAVYDWVRTAPVGDEQLDLELVHSTDNGVRGRTDRADFSYHVLPSNVRA